MGARSQRVDNGPPSSWLLGSRLSAVAYMPTQAAMAVGCR